MRAAYLKLSKHVRARFSASQTMKWIGLTTAILGIAFLPAPQSSTEPATHHFQIQASSFAYSPATIRVNPGDQVTLEVVSTDVVHSLYIDDYDLEVRAEPGKTARLAFTADQAGTFRIRCSITCGALHPFMIGKLQVGPNNLLWKSLALALVAILASVWSFKMNKTA